MAYSHLVTALQQSPPTNPGAVAWPLTLGCTTLFMADGTISEAEFNELVSALSILGADTSLIEQYITGVTSRLAGGGGLLAQEALATMVTFAAAYEYPERMQLYRYLMAAVHADAEYTVDEFSTLSAFGEALGFTPGQQLSLISAFTPALIAT